MTTTLDSLDKAILKIDGMLCNVSKTSITSSSEVADGLLDLRLLVIESQKLQEELLTEVLISPSDLESSIV